MNWHLHAVLTGAVMLCAGVSGAAAASTAKDVEAIFQPFRVAQAALAPDGQHVAFMVQERGGIEVRVYAVNQPQVIARIPVDSRRAAETRYLVWATNYRIVAATDTPLIAAFDLTGGNKRALIDPKTFVTRDDPGRRITRVLGLASDDPAALMIETTHVSFGQVQLELLRVDINTGVRQERYRTELERPGGSLIVDRQGKARLVFLQGGLPHRFLYRPAAEVGGWRRLDRVAGAVTAAFQVTPQNFLGERSLPLGFAEDPDVLYFASNAGRDTFGVYALDFRTGRRTEFAVEDREFDLAELALPWVQSPLVFDRSRRTLAGVRRIGLDVGTKWVDPEMATIAAALERKFPGRSAQVLEWDEARERFLVLVASSGDPGRYFVHHRSDGRCVEYLRRSNVPLPEKLNRTEPFTFVAPDGMPTSGYLTMPHAPAVAKPPLLVWLHDGPWKRTAPEFNRDAQALATMGFVVAQVDYRGSAGFGRTRREAIRGALDAAPLAEVEAVVAWLGARHTFDRRRIAIAGEGFGGYLALRALQRQPDAYRCAVSINAPVELADLRRSLQTEERSRREFEQEMTRSLLAPALTPEERDAASERRAAAAMSAPVPPVDFDQEMFRWLTRESGGGADMSALRHAHLITKPVMLLHDPRHRTVPVDTVRELRSALERRKQPVAYAEISPQFARGFPSARAQVIRRIGEFLNVTLYDFDVKVGEAKEKEGP